jgi:hypothetical protein
MMRVLVRFDVRDAPWAKLPWEETRSVLGLPTETASVGAPLDIEEAEDGDPQRIC